MVWRIKSCAFWRVQNTDKSATYLAIFKPNSGPILISRSLYDAPAILLYQSHKLNALDSIQLGAHRCNYPSLTVGALFDEAHIFF